MQNKKYILAIDQGTSSTKSLIFDSEGKQVVKGVVILLAVIIDKLGEKKE